MDKATEFAESELIRVGFTTDGVGNLRQEIKWMLVRAWEQGFGAARASNTAYKKITSPSSNTFCAEIEGGVGPVTVASLIEYVAATLWQCIDRSEQMTCGNAPVVVRAQYREYAHEVFEKARGSR